MDENLIRQKLEELDPGGVIPNGLVEELVASITKEKIKINLEGETLVHDELKSKIEQTDDWREKAKIAAKIISLNLS